MMQQKMRVSLKRRSLDDIMWIGLRFAVRVRSQIAYVKATNRVGNSLVKRADMSISGPAVVSCLTTGF